MKKVSIIGLILIGLFFGVTQVFGVANDAINFSGDNNCYSDFGQNPFTGIYVDNENDFDFYGEDFAVSYWIKTDATALDNVSKMSDWYEAGWICYYANDKVDFYFNDPVFSDTHIQTGTLNWLDDEFHHIVCSLSSTTASVYFDGSLEGSGSIASTGNWNNDTPVRLNLPDCRNGTGTAYDEFRIYNRALESAEVTEQFNLVYNDNTALIASYNFDNESETIVDRSGSGNTGHATGTIPVSYPITWISGIEEILVSWLPITENFVWYILSYVKVFLGSGISVFLAMVIGIPLAFVVLKRIIDLVPKK